ncbi:MAG: 50S ribosomal protein L10 [candidate division NC10 bacterium]|nr:50S ribosomal protein L10 [candidate division NC10 bacterium]
MATAKKETEVKQLQERFRSAKTAILTDFRGLSVADMTALRNLLRKSNIEYRVIKNRLAKIAVQDTPFAGLDPLLSGPTAIALAREDPAAASRLLSQFVRTNEHLGIRGGIIEGRLYRKEEILAIAELPPREILISQVVSAVASPLSGFLRVLRAPLVQLLGTLDAIRSQKEKVG